jgi:hypothetical protein
MSRGIFVPHYHTPVFEPILFIDRVLSSDCIPPITGVAVTVKVAEVVSVVGAQVIS